ncbi:MAG: RcpC/CpaB family pilus assembly protein [Sneathiellales bacterium]|nr:RcpC/CpaB family pilus assembly protein [Sneathiellales bacterium]
MKSAFLFLASLLLLSVSGYLGYVLVSQKPASVVAAERPARPMIILALSRTNQPANSILSSSDILWTETGFEGEKAEFVTREMFHTMKATHFLVLKAQKAGSVLRKTDILMEDDADFMMKALRDGHRLMALNAQDIAGGHDHLRPGNILSIYFSPDVPHPASGTVISPSVRLISRSNSLAPEGKKKDPQKTALYLEIPMEDLDIVTRAMTLGKISLVLKPDGKASQDRGWKPRRQEILALLSSQQGQINTEEAPKWRQVTIHRGEEIQIEKRRADHGSRLDDD